MFIGVPGTRRDMVLAILRFYIQIAVRDGGRRLPVP